jgi:hypothetical protein
MECAEQRCTMRPLISTAFSIFSLRCQARFAHLLSPALEQLVVGMERQS